MCSRVCGIRDLSSRVVYFAVIQHRGWRWPHHHHHALKYEAGVGCSRGVTGTQEAGAGQVDCIQRRQMHMTAIAYSRNARRFGGANVMTNLQESPQEDNLAELLECC